MMLINPFWYVSGGQLIFTIKTDNNGTSLNNQFTIPTRGGYVYDYSVTTSDNQTINNNVGDLTISFTTPGTYDIKISGIFPTIYFNNVGDKDKIINVKQWGTIIWDILSYSFYGCSNIIVTAIDKPILTNVTTLHRMFSTCTSLTTPNLVNWEVSNVIDFGSMFLGCRVFNGDMSSWLMPTTINYSTNAMFNGCGLFTGFGLNSWDFSRNIDMGSMFKYCESFNVDISGWDVSNVTSLISTFERCVSFTLPNLEIGNWDVSNVTTFNGTFRDIPIFNININGWDMSNAIHTSNMFRGCTDFNQPLDLWDMSNVQLMPAMFANCTNFNQPLNSWDTSSLIGSNSGIFFSAASFNQDLDNWEMTNVTIIGNIFQGAFSFNGNISTWDVSNNISLERAFDSATSFNQDLSTWDFSETTGFFQMGNNWDMSTENIDKLLIVLSNTVTINDRITTMVGTYSLGTAAEVAFLDLTVTRNWTISGLIGV